MRIAQFFPLLLLPALCLPLSAQDEAPNAEAVSALKALGGNVMRIAQNDPRR